MLKLKAFGLTFTLYGKHTLSNERYKVFQSFLLFECSSLENKPVWHASASVNMGVFQSNKRSHERSRAENHMNLPSEATCGTLSTGRDAQLQGLPLPEQDVFMHRPKCFF